MSKLSHRLKEEIGKVLWATAFFATAFCVVIVVTRLMVRGSEIEIVGFGTAIFSAFVIAKVLIVVNLLPFVDAFPNKPIVYNILWKTPIYVSASIAFKYVEHIVRGLVRGLGASGAHREVMELFSTSMFWANQIWIALVFLVFLSAQELTRAIGRDTMLRIFLGR